MSVPGSMLALRKTTPGVGYTLARLLIMITIMIIMMIIMIITLGLFPSPLPKRHSSSAAWAFFVY